MVMTWSIFCTSSFVLGLAPVLALVLVLVIEHMQPLALSTSCQLTLTNDTLNDDVIVGHQDPPFLFLVRHRCLVGHRI